MRKNKKTILLAKIRRHIRNAIDWSKVGDGMPHFYTTNNYKRSKKCTPPVKGNYPYYCKATRAIEDITEKIFNDMEKYKNEQD